MAETVAHDRTYSMRAYIPEWFVGCGGKLIRSMCFDTRRPISVLSLVFVVLAMTFTTEIRSAEVSKAGKEVRFVRATNLNLRTEPATESQVLAELPRGHTVIQLERQGDWARIAAFKPGTQELIEGWVVERFLTKAPAAGPARGQGTSATSGDGLQIDDVRFDCDESYLDGGLKNCTVEADLRLQGPSWVQMNVSVSCSADVRFTDATGRSQTDLRQWLLLSS